MFVYVHKFSNSIRKSSTGQPVSLFVCLFTQLSVHPIDLSFCWPIYIPFFYLIFFVKICCILDIIFIVVLLFLVIAIELLAACQGIEFLRPLTTTEPLEAVHSLVRSHVK